MSRCAECPECSEKLDLERDRLEVGEIVICFGCGEELSVVRSSPVRLESRPEDPES